MAGPRQSQVPNWGEFAARMLAEERASREPEQSVAYGWDMPSVPYTESVPYSWDMPSVPYGPSPSEGGDPTGRALEGLFPTQQAGPQQGAADLGAAVAKMRQEPGNYTFVEPGAEKQFPMAAGLPQGQLARSGFIPTGDVRENFTYGEGGGRGATEDTLRKLLAQMPARITSGHSSRTVVKPLLSARERLEAEQGITRREEGQSVIIGELGRLKGILAGDTARIQEARQLNMESELARVREREAYFDKEVTRQMGENNALLQKIKDTKLDPDRVKGNAIWNGIAMALGAFGATLGKTGTNMAAQIIQDAKDRDLRAQIADLTSKRGALEAGRGMLADIYRAKGDLRESIAMYRIIQADIADTAIKAMTSQSGQEQQPWLTAQAQIDNNAQAALARQELAKLTHERVSTTSGGSSQTNIAPQMLLLKAALAGKLGPEGVPGAAKKELPPTMIGKLAEENQRIVRVKRLIDKVKGKSLTPVDEIFAMFGTDAAEIGPQLRAMARQIGRALGTDVGAFAVSDAKAVEEALMTKNWNKAAPSVRLLKESLSDMVQQYERKLKGLGVHRDITGIEPVKK